MQNTVNIIFENENFIVCDKPANVLSTPDRHKSDRGCLGLDLQKKLNLQIYPVHRLDFEVSGLIMYAKNKKSHQISQDWFLNKTITKKYRALTLMQNFSHWPEQVKTERELITPAVAQNFFWKTQIQRGKRRSFESIHGDWAETRAEVSAVIGGIIHWDLYPLTGKPHQLRLELSRRGFPILGDQLYGSGVQLVPEIWKFGPVALRAVEIDLTNIEDRMGLPEKITVKNPE